MSLCSICQGHQLHLEYAIANIYKSPCCLKILIPVYCRAAAAARLMLLNPCVLTALQQESHQSCHAWIVSARIATSVVGKLVFLPPVDRKPCENTQLAQTVPPGTFSSVQDSTQDNFSLILHATSMNGSSAIKTYTTLPCTQ